MKPWRNQADKIFQFYKIPPNEQARLIQEATNLEAYLQRIDLTVALKNSLISLGVLGDYRVTLERKGGLRHKNRNTFRGSETNCLVAVIFFYTNNYKRGGIVEWLVQQLG